MSIDISFGYICSLLCCPPWPSRITRKLAFHPPTPSYDLVFFNESISLIPKRKHIIHYGAIEAFFVKTRRGHRIACALFKICNRPRKTILYSHGNAVDLGQMMSFHFAFGQALRCNIFSYDYSGYGRSEGHPSEKNIYADIEAACHVLLDRYGLDPKNIVLYGKSLGTVATIDLATKHKVAGVVLHSPLMSGIRVAFPEFKRNCFFDSFVSTGKTPMIESPVLVIHGTNDKLVNQRNGLAVYDSCPNSVDPLWISGGGHNNLERYKSYWKRLKYFIRNELDD